MYIKYFYILPCIKYIQFLIAIKTVYTVYVKIQNIAKHLSIYQNISVNNFSI